MLLPTEAAHVISEGHVGRASKGWVAATLSEPLESVGWPRAVEVYSRRGSRSEAICTFAVAQPDHDEALAESWRTLATRHPDTVLHEHQLSHDWVDGSLFKGLLVEQCSGSDARVTRAGGHAASRALCRW